MTFKKSVGTLNYECIYIYIYIYIYSYNIQKSRWPCGSPFEQLTGGWCLKGLWGWGQIGLLKVSPDFTLNSSGSTGPYESLVELLIEET